MGGPATRLELLAARARLLKEMRRFFDERDFVEVQTPTVVPSPGLDVHLDAFEVRGVRGETVGWLSTSPEYQMKRLLCDGAERIYQLAPAYRDDEYGALHEREFLMLEWYRAGVGVDVITGAGTNAGSDAVMRDTEALIKALARSFCGSTVVPTAFGEVDVAAPWDRLTVAEAFRKYADADAAALAADEDAFFLSLAERVQPQLGNERPVFLTDWPAPMASLARLNDNGTADRFEAFIHGVEICNGFGELTDAQEQRRRFETDQDARRAAGKPVYPIDEGFLADLERGMPESGGNALGVDRVLMLLTGAARVQDVMLFPVKQL